MDDSKQKNIVMLEMLDVHLALFPGSGTKVSLYCMAVMPF